jgi:partner of Y14 and mago protein
VQLGLLFCDFVEHRGPTLSDGISIRTDPISFQPTDHSHPASTMPSEPTASGIVTDESGERHIPESRRADGSTRKAIKIRPGYRPPEDVEVYKNRTAENFRNRGKGPVPGAEGLKDDKPAQPSSAAANKNAKRREARKKAKAAGESQEQAPAEEVKKEELDPEAEKEKKVRTLKKKLRQAKELKEKKEGGGALLPEQIAKVIKINELIRELDALGFDSEGEPKADAAASEAKDASS